MNSIVRQVRRRDRLVIALDKRSVRNYDYDGRLHVAVSNISKATVNPYVGREIPDWEALRLDPNKLYYLYRDPEELEKAAATFNGLPLLSEHQPVTSDEHDKSLTVGATGTDAVYEHPYLKNSLVIWPSADIQKIESDVKRQVSCGYRYTADMTPGTTPDGEKYDGVMRDIVGNHVALVKEGRAGPDVIIGDGVRQIRQSRKAGAMRTAGRMTRRAALTIKRLAPFIRSRLAQDESVDLLRLVAPVTRRNWAADRQRIVRGLVQLCRGRLAYDASTKEVEDLLDDIHAGGSGDEPAPRQMQEEAEEAANVKARKTLDKRYRQQLDSYDEDLEDEDLEDEDESDEFDGGGDDEDPGFEEEEEEPATDRRPRRKPRAMDFQRQMIRTTRSGSSRYSGDEPPPFKGRPRPGGGMDSRFGSRVRVDTMGLPETEHNVRVFCGARAAKKFMRRRMAQDAKSAGEGLVNRLGIPTVRVLR